MKNEFDNKLTDKSWGRMNRLLDREMPVRRRRFVWWPWLALLLLGSGAGGWWLYRQPVSAQPAPEPVARPKTAQPIVATPATPPQAAGQGNRAQASAAPQAGTSKEPNTRSSLSAKGLGDNRGAASPATTISQAKRQQGVIRETITGSTATGIPAVSAAPTPAPDASGIAVEEMPELPFGNTAATTASPKAPALATLPAANTSLYTKIPAPAFFTAEASVTTPSVKPAPGPERWSFGAGAGITSGDFSAINGFSVGALAEFRLSRRWGLRGGLQFAQYNLPAGERPVVSVDAQEYNKATGNDVQDIATGTPSTTADPTTVYVPLERTKRLEIPVLAYWQPVGGLRVLGGISAGYLLSTRASGMNYANNQLYLAANQDALNNLSDLTARSTSRWNLDWQLGLGWRFGKHFELDAFYKRQFNTNMKSDVADQFPPGNFNPSALDGTNGTTNYTTPSFQLQGIWFF